VDFGSPGFRLVLFWGATRRGDDDSPVTLALCEHTPVAAG